MIKKYDNLDLALIFTFGIMLGAMSGAIIVDYLNYDNLIRDKGYIKALQYETYKDSIDVFKNKIKALND